MTSSTAFRPFAGSEDLPAVTAAVRPSPLVALITGGDDHKATGPPPEAVDVLFRATAGSSICSSKPTGRMAVRSRRRAAHEPVIPSKPRRWWS